MANIKKILFWEKYRPRNMRSMILFPRIQKLIDDNIDSNYLFYGSSGIGKSTLANILSEKHNSLKLSGKLGIDIITDKIKKHFEGLDLGAKDQLKLIYIDEFDRASKQLQEGLKGFMEQYPYARFIFTTNHLHDIDKELRSRFVEISFNPQDSEERKFMFDKQVHYLRSICKKEGSELYKDKPKFDNLVKKYFPDLRKSVEMLQIAIKTDDMSMFDKTYNNGKEDLYKFILDKNLSPVINYDFVMENYFVDFENAFEYLGRPFFEYLREQNIDLILNKGAKILKIQSDYNNLYKNSPDPIIDLINYIIELKQIID